MTGPLTILVTRPYADSSSQNTFTPLANAAPQLRLKRLNAADLRGNGLGQIEEFNAPDPFEGRTRDQTWTRICAAAVNWEQTRKPGQQMLSAR